MSILLYDTAPNAEYLKENEIELPYSTFMELYQGELITYYAKIKGYTLIRASYEWEMGVRHFDQTFYDIMLNMIKIKKNRKNMIVLISKLPCINYYKSFAPMYVAKVKKDIEDKTMIIPFNIRSSINIDFDDCTLNINRVMGDQCINYFSNYMKPKKKFCWFHIIKEKIIKLKGE